MYTGPYELVAVCFFNLEKDNYLKKKLFKGVNYTYEEIR